MTRTKPELNSIEYLASLAVDTLNVTHTTMWEALRRSRDRSPEATAVVAGERAWSYEQLVDAALSSASRLAELGVEKGSRVAYAFHSCPEWIALHYALARLGAVAVPLNLVLEARELAHVLRASEPELLISIRRFGPIDMERKLATVDSGLVAATDSLNAQAVAGLRAVHLLDVDDSGTVAHNAIYRGITEPHRSMLSEPSDVGADDPAYLLFTSGSTATPKAVICPHRSFLGAAQGWAYALDLEPTDRFLNMLPTFHTGGITCGITAPHIAGASTHLLGGFEPGEAIRQIETSRCTTTVGFDTMMTKILVHPRFEDADVTSLRKIALGCTPSYYEHLRAVWDLDLLVMTYGSTESGSLAAIVPANETVEQRRRDSNGRPLPGIEIRVVDPETGALQGPDEPGEICFRGWSRFLRYDGMPEETAEAIDEEGFFHSGDYGWVGADGYLYFRGRYKHMIKTGGENVSEREVEIFLEQQLPEVDFAQVVGAPSDTWGEMVVAFVQLAPTVAAPPDPAQLRAACRGQIAGYKIPKMFLFVRAEDWLVLANGRPDKHALRELAKRRTAAGSEDEPKDEVETG